MPSCVSCGCPSCVWADVYTTSFVAFCPTGTTTRVYEVQEYYTGLSAAPSVTKRPSVPYGFTSEVQTCTVCGPKPVTASVTYAATNYPFATGLSGPSPAPNGVPGWVVKPEGDKLGWTPAGYVSPLSGKFEAGWVPYSGPGSADAKAPGMPGAPNGPYVASPPPGAAGSKPLPGGGSGKQIQIQNANQHMVERGNGNKPLSCRRISQRWTASAADPRVEWRCVSRRWTASATDPRFEWRCFSCRWTASATDPRFERRCVSCRWTASATDPRFERRRVSRRWTASATNAWLERARLSTKGVICFSADSSPRRSPCV